ncbi:MAG TPA: dTDP-4-dehydrorhamnose 3,5-epimerase [Myxococcota bacterium]|nr:dTDP-4-dehydrorhamnose 3,5-epimerase [Myxococcota bacterium]
MKAHATEVPGVLLVEPQVFRDERGFFLESFQARKYAAAGMTAVFVQDNHSLSRKGTLRGLHAQLCRPQGKLIRVIEGEIWDVAVDIRPGSPTYRKHVSAVLSSENFRQLWVPPGLAHGFCVLSERAQVEYKCTDFYDPADELVVAWNDPGLAIPWPIAAPVLSERDRNGTPLDELAPKLTRSDDTAR